MTVFWATVLTVFTVYWSIRTSRWARRTDRAQRKLHAEMQGELQRFIAQMETRKGPHDPGSGMAGDRA